MFHHTECRYKERYKGYPYIKKDSELNATERVNITSSKNFRNNVRATLAKRDYYSDEKEDI